MPAQGTKEINRGLSEQRFQTPPENFGVELAMVVPSSICPQKQLYQNVDWFYRPSLSYRHVYCECSASILLFTFIFALMLTISVFHYGFLFSSFLLLPNQPENLRSRARLEDSYSRFRRVSHASELHRIFDSLLCRGSDEYNDKVFSLSSRHQE